MTTVIPMPFAPDDHLRAGLEASLAVPRYVDEVFAAAPFAGVSELLAAADAAASSLSPAEIDQAMAHHPRIGERPVGEGSAQDHSRREQAAVEPGDDELAAGNRAYESRFDRVFLIRAAGRTKPEILAELRRRLELDDDAELAVVADQLKQIALLRLSTLEEPA